PALAFRATWALPHSRLLTRLEQLADLAAQLLIAAAGLLQEGRPPAGRELDRRDEHVPDSLGCGVHGLSLHGSLLVHAPSIENPSGGKVTDLNPSILTGWEAARVPAPQGPQHVSPG